MATYYTADTHFSHYNILDFCPHRKKHVETIEEMDAMIIENWNKSVKPQDTVYHLGDVGVYTPERAKEVIQQLNGKIHLISGNHDRKQHLKAYAPYLESIELVGMKLKYHKTHLFLSHYGIDVPWRMFSIHGHIHEREYENHNKINIGVDSPLTRHLPFGEPVSHDLLWMIIEDRKQQMEAIIEYNKQKRSRQ